METADSKNKKCYRQVFRDNMSIREDPIIKDYKKEDFTKISFEPDLKRFGMNRLDEDIVSLMTKRVYDLAGVTPACVKIYLNEEHITVRNFNSYVDLYLQNEESKDLPKLIEKCSSERWEVICSLSDGQFQQVSFVNSICTIKGGTHVTYIADQIVNRIMTVVQKKEKNITIKPHQIRANLWLFVNAQIENPAFDS